MVIFYHIRLRCQIEVEVTRHFGVLDRGISFSVELKLDHGSQNAAHLFMHEAQ